MRMDGASAPPTIGHTRGSSTIRTEEVSVTRCVAYEDLDLRAHAGAGELRWRVEETARLACRQLDELYPLEQPEAPACGKDAIAAAERGAKQK